MPHQTAGRMEESLRAKSQGCHGRGTLRTTATRGCSSDEDCWPCDCDDPPVAPPAAVLVLPGVVAIRAGVDGLNWDVVGEEGTEEARWWERRAMAKKKNARKKKPKTTRDQVPMECCFGECGITSLGGGLVKVAVLCIRCDALD